MERREFDKLQKDYVLAEKTRLEIRDRNFSVFEKLLSDTGYTGDNVPESILDELDQKYPKVFEQEYKEVSEIKKAAEMALLIASIAVAPQAGITIDQLLKAPYTIRQEWIDLTLKLDPYSIPAELLKRA